MKNKELPAALLKELERHKLPAGEIEAYAECDFDLDFDYRKTYLFLTRKNIIFAVCPKSPERTYSGFAAGKHARFENKDIQIEEIYYFDLNETEEIFTVSYIVGGAVTLKTKEGEKALCICSNTCMKKLGAFISAFSKLKAGEEPDETESAPEEEEFCPKCGAPYPEKGRNVCPRCMDKRSVFFRIFAYFRPYRLYFAVVTLFILVNAGISLIAPYLSGIVFFNQALGGDKDALELLGFKTDSFAFFLLVTVALILLTNILQLLFSVIQGRLVAHFVPRAVADIKNDVFRAMQNLSVSFFKSRRTGGLMTRVNDDANQVFNFFVDGVPYLLVNVLKIVSSLAVMFWLNWQLSVFAVVFMPLVFMVTYFMLPKLWHFYGKRHRSIRAMNSHLNDNITGARVVKAFGRQENEIGRFDKVNRNLRESEIKLVNFDIKFNMLFDIVIMLSGYVVWIVGGWLIIQPESTVTYGMIITFVGYVNMLAGPMDFISYIFRWGSNSLNSGQRIFEILDARPEITEKKDCVHLDSVKGRVEMRNVVFEYETGKPVLKSVSFSVDAGQMLGIVGKSGAGKSTIANLLTRMYDPLSGEVLLDGVNLKNIAIADIRKSIGIVSQEIYIFKGTVAENIAYAKPGCTKAEIVRAAVCANAHDFICRLPDGYDTVIGLGGHALSGGERQRISIARATLADPTVLILDEATASVDTKTELAINAAIEKLSKGKTVISIAHRLSTLKGADKLIVIENGKVSEEGTHSELAARKDGIYQKLLQIQSKALALRGIEYDGAN